MNFSLVIQRLYLKVSAEITIVQLLTNFTRRFQFHRHVSPMPSFLKDGRMLVVVGSSEVVQQVRSVSFRSLQRSATQFAHGAWTTRSEELPDETSANADFGRIRNFLNIWVLGIFTLLQLLTTAVFSLSSWTCQRFYLNGSTSSHNHLAAEKQVLMLLLKLNKKQENQSISSHCRQHFPFLKSKTMLSV